MLRKANFSAETVALMGRVCDDAWRELEKTTFYPSPSDEREMRNLVASSVMAAVAAGERDPQRLMSVALEAVTG